MKLEELVRECSEAICEDIEQSILSGLSHAVATVDTNDGYIDIHSDRRYGLEVYVYHDDDTRVHDCQLLETYLEENIVADWYGIEEAIEESELDEL